MRSIGAKPEELPKDPFEDLDPLKLLLQISFWVFLVTTHNKIRDESKEGTKL